ncbi:hypothetical protein KXD93_21780 [Mucilaginibacter sp. BJC16-A38]|uniref:hypothetical protein n=1 Tax=Mucilaginibacter phenanthrenivorans TaxID=1234842 RepID=UPI002157FA20|nr:hypothetical protein [Mucilaginibacter phenanthrenivorans]MCR8560298.1 hypothetical protein [Mucilaginibacter phenanthrenivorans]
MRFQHPDKGIFVSAVKTRFEAAQSAGKHEVASRDTDDYNYHAFDNYNFSTFDYYNLNTANNHN